MHHKPPAYKTHHYLRPADKSNCSFRLYLHPVKQISNKANINPPDHSLVIPLAPFSKGGMGGFRDIRDLVHGYIE